MRMFFSYLLLAISVALSPAHAGYHGLNLDDVAKFEILPGWRTKDGTHMTALRVQLAPGWKTYWRAPGEAGIPPRFDWGQSDNLRGVQFVWPAPEVFEQNGMRSVGYERELVLPIELFPTHTDRAIAMRADVEIGVCEDICIPVSVRIAADINGNGAADARITSAMNARADTAKEAGVARVSCRIDPIKDGLRLTASIQMPALSAKETTVFELPDQSIWVAEAVSQRQGNVLTAVTEMVPPSNRPFSLDRSTIRMTVIGGGRAVDIQGCKG